MINKPTAPKLFRPCDDCGQEYEDYRFLGVRIGHYCQECRDIRNRAFHLEREQRHQAALEHHRKEWLTDPIRGIPGRFQGMTWEDFKYDRGGEKNRRKVEQFREYATNFPVDHAPKGVESLLITRELNGVGKTLLACLILQDIINRSDQISRERSPFQFWAVGRMKQRLKSAERFGGPETVEDVIKDFSTMWLLVLDDVGKEKLVGADLAFSNEMYYTIINERYNNERPVILTSNLHFEPCVEDGMDLTDLVGRAGVSRLMEMTGGVAYVIDGEERR